MTLDENLLLVSHPNGPEELSHVEYQFLSMPSSMALYHRLNGQQPLQNGFTFSQTQLSEGDILLGVNNRSTIRDRVRLECISFNFIQIFREPRLLSKLATGTLAAIPNAVDQRHFLCESRMAIWTKVHSFSFKILQFSTQTGTP